MHYHIGYWFVDTQVLKENNALLLLSEFKLNSFSYLICPPPPPTHLPNFTLKNELFVKA
jgi:hypothetical protein